MADEKKKPVDPAGETVLSGPGGGSGSPFDPAGETSVAPLMGRTAGAGSAPVDRPSGAGTIGPYHLIEQLGQGGMGEVWLAQQYEPVHRQVALKVIRQGMDSREVISRFEAERQALALMDHPAIAMVLDAGSTPEGLPFFVMELVRGIPITDHCDRERLDVRKRLELFIEVCEGVQHAHQKAIIHRDLKPSNILVTTGEDGRARAKIIDFGVAKATGPQLMPDTMATQMGQLIGTPEYMSPEQADLSGQDIDTRTDVYALGVVLYELLTGTLPFADDGGRRAGLAETLRRIRDVEPDRPSTRLIRFGMDAADRAHSRQSEPGTLRRLLRRDLDWVVMKALEKERTRRYGSPSDLAADLGRFLRHEPLLAGPPSKSYRAGKFIRRHRVGVASAAGLAALLVALAVTMTVQASRIAKERDRANNEARTAREVSDFLVDLFEVSDPQEALGNVVTAREILDRGARRIGLELAEQPDVQARLMDTIGEVYRRLGLYDEGRPLLEKASGTLTLGAGAPPLEVARNQVHLGILLRDTGAYDRARVLLESALAIYEREHGENHPDVAATLGNLGNLALARAQFPEAEALYGRALAISKAVYGDDHPQVARALVNLAILKGRTKNLPEARTLLESALAMQERAFGSDHPDVAQTLNNLAGVLVSQGDKAGALGYYGRSLRIRERVFGPDHPDVARSLNNMGNLLQATGDAAGARELHERALAIRMKSLGPEHAMVAQSLSNLAISLKALGDYKGARENYSRALAIWQKTLGPTHPRTAIGLYNLAGLTALEGDRKTALDLLRQSVEAGFDNAAIARDEDFASLRKDPEFETLEARVLDAAKPKAQ